MAVMFDAAPTPDPIPLQQSDAFERAMAGFGRPMRRLADGTLVMTRKLGVLPLHMLTRPRATTQQALRAAIRGLDTAGPVVVCPDQPLPLHRIGALPLVSPNTIAVLNLTRNKDELMAGLHAKWRNRLRHAQRQNLRVTRQNLPDTPSHWLFHADALQQSKRGYRSWPVGLTLAYGRENPGLAKLFTAFLGREPVAAMLVLRHGGSATYHIGHARASGRLMSAHTLLMWQAMCWAKSKGVERFELGLVDTETCRGLSRFKLGTGALPQRLGGTWIWWSPATPLLRPLARLDQRLMGVG